MVFTVTLIPEHGNALQLSSGSFIIGRDPMVSRQHAELFVSLETTTVTIMALHQNGLWLTRAGEQLPFKLRAQEVQVLGHRDMIALKENTYRFKVDIKGAQRAEIGDGGDLPTMLGAHSLPDVEMGTSKRQRTETGLIRLADMQYVRRLGAGACGEVSQYQWKGTMVAVKRIFNSLLHGTAVQEFEAESGLLRRLRHPNIVLYMGTAADNNGFAIVTEFLSHGSLYDVLHSPQDLSWRLLAKLALDAATGMNFLHTYHPPILHRDLKSHNLLVDENFTVKVTDFGLARFTEEQKAAQTFCGTLPWTAPEVFTGQGYGTPADVYSFGVVLWELATRREPYHGLAAPQIIVGVTEGRLRPPPVQSPWTDLMGACFAGPPGDRPTFQELLEPLRALRQSRPPGPPPTPPTSNNGAPARVSAAPPASPVSPAPSPVASPSLTRANTPPLEEEPEEHPRLKKVGTRALVEKWEIDAAELQFGEEELQTGAYSLFRGTYHGESIAIKVMTGTGVQALAKELEVLTTLRSTALVYVYGVVLRPRLCLVTEYVPGGTFLSLMQGPGELGWPRLLTLLARGARAVAVLHGWQPQCLHGDLQASSFLLGEADRVKLTDFALARFRGPGDSQTLKKVRGSSVYIPPESVRGEEYGPHSDVYSFAIVTWEMLMRLLEGRYVRPFAEYDLPDFQVLQDCATRALRPTIPPATPPPLTELLSAAWAEHDRPTFAAIATALDGLLALYQASSS